MVSIYAMCMRDELCTLINGISNEAVLGFLCAFLRSVAENEDAFAASLAIVTCVEPGKVDE